jgi:protein SCO1/2
MPVLLAFLALTSGPLADIGPAPEVDLVDAQGRPFRLAGLRGKAVVVSFVFTTCNGTCPLTTAGLDRVRRALKARRLWGKRVDFVSISLDPARDTPDVLRRYAAAYRAEPERWHFLTGPPDRVGAVLRAWDMWARPGPSGAIDHPSRIFLVDPEGRLREIYSLETLDPEGVADDVASVLGGEEGEGRR